MSRHGCERVCGSRPVRMDQTDAAVWSEVCQLLAQPARLAQAYRQRLHPAPQSDASHNLETHMGKLRRGLARHIESEARRGQAHPAGVQGTAACHDQIT
jgi:site-specific DNA recombinase